MKRFRVLKLGTECTDNATKLPGSLTHWAIYEDHRVVYLFQPRGLNEEGQPLKKIALPAERLTVKDTDFEDADIPVEILGTEVTDKASTFKGTAISLIRHINGCFHVEIQPPGISTKSGGPIESNDFDLRGCVGKMIPLLTPEAQRQSEARNPSPSPASRSRGAIDRY